MKTDINNMYSYLRLE